MNKIFRAHLAAFFAVIFSAQAQTNTNHTAATAPPAPRRPSILLILADNIGYGDLGCYGQNKIKTPHLDELAKEGIRFTSYYVGSPNDEASRASLLTGLEPRHIGASFSRPLPVDAFTVGLLLQNAGYSNGFFGEWNLGDTPPVQPNSKGFNQFAGFLSQTHARDYFTDTIYRQDPDTGINTAVTIADDVNAEHKKYVPDMLGTFAGNFMRVNMPSKLNHYHAFFVCLCYPVPHNGSAPNDSIYSDESWPQPEKDRATMITHMDDNIGHLLDSLKQLKGDTNTVVIFTSLGGPQPEGPMDPKFFGSSGPLRGDAGSVYEGGIRVPMIIRWPARIKPGQVSDFTWAAWDFLPTAAEIAFMEPPQKTDGISMVPVLTGKGKVKRHESLYWQTPGDGTQQALRMGDWKIVQLGTNAPALYNLKGDIAEQNDASARHPDVLKKMEKLLNDSSK
jgi:arylsulfatase A-like enzyme